VFPANASDADRARITEESRRVAELLRQSNEAQRALLRHLASQSSTGQYLVPTSQWVQKMLNVTAGLTPEEIEYLRTLDWRPGHITEEELRRRVRRALANRRPQGQQSAGEGGTGGQGQGRRRGQGQGQGPGAGDGQQRQAGDRGGGDQRDAEGPARLERDRATAPPEGMNRAAAGIFAYRIDSGMTASGTYQQGQQVTCTISVAERRNGEARVFSLSGVSITFVSRSETQVNGRTVTKFRVYFTNDFWSQRHQFYGRGGADSLNEYTFPVRR
jgi:hypothetical protein